MTREQKINWMKEEATVEQILDQFKASAIAVSRAQDNGDIKEMFKHMEDMELCKTELIARLSK